MDVFAKMAVKEHEQILHCFDHASGLKAIIAIHSTVLGPALGGCRMWPYMSEDDALNDVLRLSRGMTYKSAIAGLNLGGGKAVIIGDYKTMKTEHLFRSFGRFVRGLNGQYITAEDVGTSVRDMEWVRMETNFVTGIPLAMGGSGDPSPMTALGVFHGMRAALLHKFGFDSLAGRIVTIQGAGQVGFSLIRYLLEAKAKVIICDTDEDKTRRATEYYKEVLVLPPSEIYDVAADIFAPCALGGTINSDTIPRLRCKIVAGSANNILLDEDNDSKMLNARDILYVPDFVINSGGLINVSIELGGYNSELAIARVSDIFSIVSRLLSIAHTENISTLDAANALAERRIKAIAQLNRSSFSNS